MSIWKWWLVVAAVALAFTAGGAYYLTKSSGSPETLARDEGEPTASDEIRVEVTHPLKGAMPRTSKGPGSVQSFESAELVAGASGYLKTQTVDIGDRVTTGQVLAKVDVPDLDKQVKRHRAAVEAAQAHVTQMDAHVVSAQADVSAAKAEVVRAQAAITSTHAKAVFRGKQFRRMQDLYNAGRNPVIDERLVDEHQDDRDAAVAAEDEAHATLAKANAMVAAADAKVLQAQADVVAAAADVKVAKAEVEKAQVMVQFATITSPYTGVITYRAMDPGGYVRAATDGGSRPLLTVERTDKMRVVFQMPDRDVPYCNVGNRAVVEIDALPGPPLEAKVSRTASSEDTGSRTMHVEIDLEKNPTGKIAQGMYGHVTIFLDQSADLLSVPSSCLTGKGEQGKGSVFVVRDGKACLTPVIVGSDNGVRIAIPKGLEADDQIVLHPTGDLVDGAAVVASPEAPEEPKSH
ncbi:MAG TPA: efflux RND transporter periplasmic adaptor subunit [Planctomycetales bacterium]|jgi:RND family efflux transporter MFP subunit|nr:efflux RND transporter periplasmic adaptor subunit [Planctomycetales bacterium]